MGIDRNTLSAPRGRLLHPIRDAAAAFVVFGLISSAVTCAPSSASPNPGAFAATHETPSDAAMKAVGDASDQPAVIEIATTSSPANADAVYKRTSAGAAWLLLASAFSMLAALNLAFLRHMRRVYAMPRKRDHNR
jgi:hypothetical protein